jgi:alanine dehydrogenase
MLDSRFRGNDKVFMILPVGIPKEIKVGERRVALTPAGVQQLSTQKIPVYVQKSAGASSGFSDDDYKCSGAVILQGPGKIWEKAVLIKKVKEPIAEEFSFFRPEHLIFTYLHLASPAEKPLLEALKRSQATAIGYETIKQNGEFPLLSPMSEIAGVLAAYYAGVFKNLISADGKHISGMERAKAKMIELAAQYPAVPKGIPAGKVVILGGGHVGQGAARTAALMGSAVVVSEISEPRRRELEAKFASERVNVQLMDPKDEGRYEKILADSDVIIASVHVGGKRAPVIIDSEWLQKISAKKKIILDISIDQGGNVAESRPTDYENPLDLDSYGNLRFSVTNIPSLCGKGASLALEQVSLDYTIALAQGLDLAIKQYPELKSGINVRSGSVVTHTD